MKKLSFLIIIVVLLFAFKPDDNFVTIDKAVNAGLISCSVKVNPGSTHYIKPLAITVKNNKSTPIALKVPNGMQFFPLDSSYQNLITTQEELLTLNPEKSVTIPLYAMCTEHSDRAPAPDVHYNLGKQANDKVTKLTQYIEKQKLHDPLGQSAVWAMTSGTPLEDITGFDTTAARQLIKYVANALGKPIPPPPAPDDSRRNYYSTNYSRTMSGYFNYNFPKTMAVTIALFNKDNIVVRELYRNTKETPGSHKLEYKFDATLYNDSFYYLRLIADGEIILSSTVKTKHNINNN